VFERDPIVDHLYPIRGQSLVPDQRIPHRLTDRDDVITRAEQESIREDSLAARVVGMVPAMLGKQDRNSPSEPPPTHRRVGKWRVLMRMDQVNLLTVKQ
jgi:hypothetical protein